MLLGEQDAEHLQNLGEDAKVRGCCAEFQCISGHSFPGSQIHHFLHLLHWFLQA